MDRVYLAYARQLSNEWINGGAGLARPTVGQHNSAMAMAASVLDMLANPAKLAPRGATRLAFPEITYMGPIEEVNGKRVPLLGTLAPTWSGDGGKEGRALLYNALFEALRLLAWQKLKPAGAETAPGGLLFDAQYPAGVVAVEGIAEPNILPMDDPASTIEEGEERVRVAALLQFGLLSADALTRASASGQPVDGVMRTVAVEHPQAAALTSVYAEMARRDKYRKLKIAGATGGGILALTLLVRWMTKEKHGNGQGYVELKTG